MRTEPRRLLPILAGASVLASVLTLSLHDRSAAGGVVLDGGGPLRCYKVSAVKKTPTGLPLNVTIDDIFQSTNSTLTKPELICVFANPNTNTTIEGTGFACYKLKDAPGTPKFPPSGANSQIALNAEVEMVGPELLQLGKSNLYCLPLFLPPVVKH